MEKETLYKYFSRRANAAERECVRQWVEESAENKDTFMRERHVFDVMTLVADGGAGQRVESRKRRTVYALCRIAAIIVVTFGCTYLYYSQKGLGEMPMLSVSVPAGQQLKMTLADGTSVWLNSESRLSYPAVFTGKERRVSIDGEGYFEVAHNADKPFRVETKRGEVEVLGTKFDVNAYSRDSEFSVSLLQGKVKIARGGRDYYLKPMEEARLQGNGTLRVAPIEDENAYRWIEGIISLKNDNFARIAKKFEKSYGIRIKIEKRGINERISYTGKFYQADGVQYALKVLQRDIDFRYTYDEDNHIIYIK